MKGLEGRGLFERAKPFIAVLFLQFGLAGMDVLCKAALNKGASNYVLVVYRHAVATVVIAPFAIFLDKSVVSLSLFLHFDLLMAKPYIVYRVMAKIRTCFSFFFFWLTLFCLNRKVRPKMTLPIFIKLMVLSLLE